MKIIVSFKDQDALGDVIREAAQKEVDDIKGLSEDEKEDVFTNRVGKLYDLMGQWFRYGEYVSIEIDTDLKTATVLKVE